MALLIPVLCLLAGAAAAQSSGAARAAFEGIDLAVTQLSKVTGLEPLKKVQYDTITRPQVKAFLEERIKEEIRPEDIRLDEITLERFGLIPRDFDLKRTTIDLITEQAAAFYDYRRKKLFLLKGSDLPPGGRDSERMIVVHELAHALADQHFGLGKYIKRGPDDDAAMARMAVIEGQATWLMLEVMAQQLNHSIREMPQMMNLMSAGATEAMTAQFPVLATAPLYIRQTLIFPYNQGLKFQHALVAKLGNEAFGRVFRDPPVSTQQVMHPEKYLSGVQPLSVVLPGLARAKDWRVLAQGLVGEFDHSVLIEQYLSKAEADELAPSWRGGSFGLYENKANKSIALLYASEWESEDAARRMFDAYKRILKGKWRTFKVESDSGNAVFGEGDDGPFTLRLNGKRVESTEGAASAAQPAKMEGQR